MNRIEYIKSGRLKSIRLK